MIIDEKQLKYECTQVEKIRENQIDVAVLKTSQLTMTNDIREMKEDLKLLAKDIKDLTSSIKGEIEKKVSRQELSDKLEPIYQRIGENNSTVLKIIDWGIKLAPYLVIGFLYYGIGGVN